MEKYRQILQKYWGYSSFRPLQDEIIQAIGEGKDTLGLMPTGGGKSLTFQVPAMAEEGICIVVSPLIALMKDQVENLRRKKIKSMAIFSGMTRAEIDIALDNCVYGDYKFLYVSPERLGTEIFISRVQEMKVNLLAVDESHCISQWGYDFRPSYLKIAEIRKLLPGVPCLALTATATPEVVDDIQEKLLFPQKHLLQKSFKRDNLVYVVRYTEDKFRYLLKIINAVKGSGIVYVRNRRKTVEIKEFLVRNRISADFYHAGISPELRSSKQNDWKTGKCRVIVATNAFGMGIDKPDVRFVVHMDLPDSIEAYFQEAGRGGRDGYRAYAALLFNKNDQISVQKRIETAFPDIKTIKNTYQALCNYLQVPIGAGKHVAYDINLTEFAATYKMNILTAFNSLKFLEREGYVELTEEVNNPTRVHFTSTRDDLYKFQVANSKFDGFIKLVLRTYTGLFNDYVPINEDFLSKKAGVSVKDIHNYLKTLSKSGIITYIPQKKSPYLVFTEERLDDRNLRISKMNYDTRKERYVSRVSAMLHYAKQDSRCRSEELLAYFGEDKTTPCGLCDVCTEKAETHISPQEFEVLVAQVTEKCRHSAPLVNELVDAMAKTYNSKKVLNALQWLLDNNKIVYNEQKRLELKN